MPLLLLATSAGVGAFASDASASSASRASSASSAERRAPPPKIKLQRRYFAEYGSNWKCPGDPKKATSIFRQEMVSNEGLPTRISVYNACGLASTETANGAPLIVVTFGFFAGDQVAQLRIVERVLVRGLHGTVRSEPGIGPDAFSVRFSSASAGSSVEYAFTQPGGKATWLVSVYYQAAASNHPSLATIAARTRKLLTG